MRLYLYKEFHTDWPYEAESTKIFATRSDAVEYLRQQRDLYCSINNLHIGDLAANPDNVVNDVAVIIKEERGTMYFMIERVDMPNGIQIPLGNGYTLAADVSDDIAYREVYVGVAKDDCWIQDLAVVKEVKTEDEDDIVRRPNSPKCFDTCVYANEEVEDYTHKFTTNMRKEEPWAMRNVW